MFKTAVLRRTEQKNKLSAAVALSLFFDNSNAA
jgi:hypothetical protein